MGTGSGKKNLNSVAVVGSGFAGTRAALDLAEVGVKVFLVDKENVPGGKLLALDQMFPGDTCGACKSLPGAIATGCQRQFSNTVDHPNIEFIGGASLESLAGEAGNFTLELKRQPQYIHQESCTGCGECQELCPVSGGANGTVSIISSESPQTCLPLKINKGGHYPCREACPVGINVPGVVQLVKSGRLLEAWKLIYEVNPFPSLCGHRCLQHCAQVCSGAGEEPVDIAALIRLVTDYVYNNHYPDLPLPEISHRRKEKVAVIGSGPAGLTAAYQLTRSGYSVAVLESSGQVGGLMRSKAYPYLGKMMDKEISLLRQLGVEIITGVSLGASLPVENLLYCGYQAVLIATVARITSIARIWQKVSSGGQVPSSYQVTISEKEKTPLMAALVHEPSIYNFDLPGIFAIRSLAFGSIHGDTALRAGQMAGACIDTYLASKKSAGGYEPVANWRRPSSKKSPGLTLTLRSGREKELTKKYPNPEDVVKEASRCLNCGGGCVECGICREVCPTGSIDLAAAGENLTLEVGAVVLATGLEVFEPLDMDNYGYGKLSNVVTSLEFENLLREGRLAGNGPARPSEGAAPLKIAWIQCVGSRSKRQLEYCSSVCCQYAFKEALLAKKVSPAVETVIFGMDKRPSSLDGEEYFKDALKRGVRFERTRIYRVEEDHNKNIIIRYAREDGSLQEEEFGLVVLATALIPGRLVENSAAFGPVARDEYGFALTSELSPCATTLPGVLSAGTLNGPKDIASSVIEARAAAMGVLDTLDNYLLFPDKALKSFDQDEEPRVGVFVCSCGKTVDKVISTSSLALQARALPKVRYAGTLEFACLPEGLARMKNIAKKYDFNRVVLAGCTPRLRHAEVLEALEEAGVLPEQVERVNIREQVAWVHRGDRVEAKEKALNLIRAGVRKAIMTENGPASAEVVNSSLLVVGGTLGGLSAALAAAEKGVRVYLQIAEKSLADSLKTSGGCHVSENLTSFTENLVEKVSGHPRIELLTLSRIVSVSGRPGNYLTEVAVAPGRKRMAHGAVILAGGAHRGHAGIIAGAKGTTLTLDHFGRLIDREVPGGVETIVFSPPLLPGTDEISNYSRAGCTAALRSALKAKNLQPGLNIYFLYRELLVSGKGEVLYREARSKGIIFMRLESGALPQIGDSGGRLQIEVVDHILGEPVLIEPDLLVVEEPVFPDLENLSLAGLYGISLREDGYFQEADQRFLPLDTRVPGVYLCGMARGPASPEDEIVQGRAAAMGALTFLVKERPRLGRHIARVVEKYCNGCGLCLSACPAGARRLDPETKTAVVDQVRCQGCGACQAACRSAATHQVNLSKKQVLEVIDELLN